MRNRVSRIFKELSFFSVMVLIISAVIIWRGESLRFINLKQLDMDEAGFIYVLDDKKARYSLYKINEAGLTSYIKEFKKYDALRQEIYRIPNLYAAGGKLYLHQEIYDNEKECIAERIIELTEDGREKVIFSTDEIKLEDSLSQTAPPPEILLTEPSAASFFPLAGLEILLQGEQAFYLKSENSPPVRQSAEAPAAKSSPAARFSRDYNGFIYDNFSYIDGKLYFLVNIQQFVYLLHYENGAVYLHDKKYNIGYINNNYNDVLYAAEYSEVIFAGSDARLWRSLPQDLAAGQGGYYPISGSKIAYTDGLYYAEGKLAFQDLKNDRIMRYDLSSQEISQLGEETAANKRSPVIKQNRLGFIAAEDDAVKLSILPLDDPLALKTVEKPVIAPRDLFKLLQSKLLWILLGYLGVRAYIFWLFQFNTKLVFKLSLLLILILMISSLLIYQVGYLRLQSYQEAAVIKQIETYQEMTYETLLNYLSKAGAMENVTLDDLLKYVKAPYAYRGANKTEMEKLGQVLLEIFDLERISEIGRDENHELFSIFTMGYNQMDKYAGKHLGGQDIVNEFYLKVEGNFYIAYSFKNKTGLNVDYFYSNRIIEKYKVNDYALIYLENTAESEIQEMMSREGRWIYKLKNLDGSGNEVLALIQTGVNMEIMENSIRLSALSILFPVLGVGFFIFAVFSILILVALRPVKELKNGVERILEQEWGYQVAITSKDEVGEITAAFNRMSDFLKRYIDEAMQLNKSYRRFLPENIFHLFETQKIQDIELGDYKKARLTLLYLNIHNFSRLASSANENELLFFLNNFFERVVGYVSAHGGFISNYHRSGFTAVFRAEPAQALEAALSIQESLKNYNQARKLKKREEVKVKITLSCGEAVVGVIGNDERLSVSVISEHIRLITYIETISHTLGAELILTEEAFTGLEAEKTCQYRELGSLILEEFERTVKVFDFYTCDPPEVKKAKIRAEADFKQGIEQFYARNFSEARKYFIKVLRTFPRDNITKIYLYQCDQYAESELIPEKLGIYL